MNRLQMTKPLRSANAKLPGRDQTDNSLFSNSSAGIKPAVARTLILVPLTDQRQELKASEKSFAFRKEYGATRRDRTGDLLITNLTIKA